MLLPCLKLVNDIPTALRVKTKTREGLGCWVSPSFSSPPERPLLPGVIFLTTHTSPTYPSHLPVIISSGKPPSHPRGPASALLYMLVHHVPFPSGTVHWNFTVICTILIVLICGTDKNKCCQLNHDTPLILRYILTSEMLNCESQNQ